MKDSVKRGFDLVVAGLLLVALSPLLLALAVLVKCDSPGPVLFRQKRLGKGARLFEIIKFRTMVFHPEGDGPSITGNNDSRVTRLGRMLRRYDLDELPTLFNVLKGEMSVVGPRPEVPDFLPYYTDEQRRVFTVKPGLTDVGTLAFRHEVVLLPREDVEHAYVRDVLPHKLALNLQYVRKQSFCYDLHLIFRTVAAIVSQPKGSPTSKDARG